MTVSSTQSRTTFAGNGVTTAFATSPIVFFDDSDLNVYLVVDSTGVSTLKTITTHYTVSGGDGSTGTVTMVTAPATGETLVIERAVGVTQASDLVNNDSSDAEVLEDALDRLTMIAQEAQSALARTLRQPAGEAVDIDAIPNAVDRASKYLAFNSAGDPVAVAAATASGTSVTATGSTTARLLAEWFTDFYSVKSFGAVGDGVTDDTVALQAAIVAAAAGDYPLFFPAGTYLTGKLTIYTGVKLIGAGVGLTTIKLKNSANSDLIYADGSDALYGGNTDAGITNFAIREMTLDGNLANNATGQHGISFYGSKPHIENVWIKNCKQRGMRTEWYQYGEAVFGMEGTFKNIVIDGCGREGWHNNGPHDSHIENVVILDCSQTTDNTYDGYVCSTYGAGHHFNVHVWNRSTATKFHRRAMSIESAGSEFTGCITEGAKTDNLYVSGAQNIFNAHRAYSARGGCNVRLRSNNNVFRGYLGAELAGSTDVKGVILGDSGDSVIGNIVDAIIIEQLAGAVDWTYSGGNNIITMRGTLASGVSYVGSPHADDKCDIRVTGAAAFRFAKDPTYVGISAAGTVQGDATALFQGYRLYQVGTVAAGTGVRLWTTVEAGEDAMIVNAGANTLNVYPASGDQIDLAGTNAAVTIASGKAALFRSSSTGQWYRVAGA